MYSNERDIEPSLSCFGCGCARSVETLMPANCQLKGAVEALNNFNEPGKRDYQLSKLIANTGFKKCPNRAQLMPIAAHNVESSQVRVPIGLRRIG